MNSSSPAGIADGVKTNVTDFVTLRFSAHDPAHPGPDSAGVQVPVVTRSLAEDAFLDQHREPGRAQSSLQARTVVGDPSQVTCTVPSLRVSTVNAAVRMCTDSRPGVSAPAAPGAATPMAEGDRAERPGGDRRGWPARDQARPRTNRAAARRAAAGRAPPPAG